MDGLQLIELLEAAGHFARSYSGRAMYGARCVAIDLDSAGDLFKLGCDIGFAAAEDGKATTEELRELGVPLTDSMGRGIIAYWRYVAWPEGHPEVETWICGGCDAKNREADITCNDCGYPKEDE